MIAVLACLSWPAAARAQEADLPGSQDPFEVERYPRSWIVAFEDDAEVRPRDFVMSRVDRIRRELRVTDQVRVDAHLTAVTYRIPDGVGVDEVVAHYRTRLGSDVLFRCSGRDCGRSNDWANQIFGQATLYGPDQEQRYAALEWQDKLVALYVIQRGNKRVYAHLRFLDPVGAAGLEPNALLARRLAERGWATIDGVRPVADGGLGAEADPVLTGLAEVLESFADQAVYVVCHLGGSAAVEVLLDASRRCAEAGRAQIAAGIDEQGSGRGPELQAFGAGPLLPRPGQPASRIELVAPAASRDAGE